MKVRSNLDFGVIYHKNSHKKVYKTLSILIFMKLIVSGGGSGDDSKEQDALFASMLDKSKPLLYIPIAMDTTDHSYPDCLMWLKSTFEKLGVIDYEMFDLKSLEKPINIDPNNYSGIYIGGGNTPFLLKKLKESGFWNFLKKAIEKDIPIMGGSAGALILAKSIVPCLNHDMNWVKLNDFSGMNCINEWEISCHYINKEKEEIIKMIKDNSIKKLIALSEKNGLYVSDEGIKLIGQESAVIFNNGDVRELGVGEFIN